MSLLQLFSSSMYTTYKARKRELNKSEAIAVITHPREKEHK